MSRKKPSKHRLVPLEILYPSRPVKEVNEKTTEKAKKFVKPGVAARIPERSEEHPRVRLLRARTILKDLQDLEKPLRDIEDDSAFVANAMNAALQVPKAIDLTFNRIHGRIYDIQREIEYSSNSADDHAKKVQVNFRAFRERSHYNIIVDAINNTVRRDCAPIHKCFLGFLLSYAKGDESFKMRLNRRFLVRNRNALKYWRTWSLESRAVSEERKVRIAEWQERVLQRICGNFLRDWCTLSFSKHSRKALRELHGKIAAEAQKRLADRSDTGENGASILEMLAIEREQVIIDYGRQNYNEHMKRVVLSFWKVYMEQCRKESRSGNAVAREFRTHRMKKSFFVAWFSLSVGRVVLFGGYEKWQRPVNRRKAKYEENMAIESKVMAAWRWLCVRRTRIAELAKERQRRFLRHCLLEAKDMLFARRERLSGMMETYITILRQRTHRVFEQWHCFTVKEKVRRQPMMFMLKRSQLMRQGRIVRRTFRRWSVRFVAKQTSRFSEETKTVDEYIGHWESAGNEMKESMVLIGQLNDKLSEELGKRKNDLNRSLASANFAKHEQLSVAFAMQNMKFEIERMHKIIAKSTMRYFVEIKPVHGHVVGDVPAALRQYIEQKEQEKQRLAAQKSNAQGGGAGQQPRIAQGTARGSGQLRDASKRRKTGFGRKMTMGSTSASTTASVRAPGRQRKSVMPMTDFEEIIEEE